MTSKGSRPCPSQGTSRRDRITTGPVGRIREHQCPGVPRIGQSQLRPTRRIDRLACDFRGGHFVGEPPIPSPRDGFRDDDRDRTEWFITGVDRDPPIETQPVAINAGEQLDRTARFLLNALAIDTGFGLVGNPAPRRGPRASRPGCWAGRSRSRSRATGRSRQGRSPWPDAGSLPTPSRRASVHRRPGPRPAELEGGLIGPRPPAMAALALKFRTKEFRVKSPEGA